MTAEGASRAVTPFRLRYMPAFDGMRAIAVLAVVFLHTEVPGFRGGFFGVDIFFVLSGFLITSLLLDEHATTGHIVLTKFYVRRALRLFPALVLMTAAILAWPWLFDMEIRDAWRSALTALAYFSNWAYALDLYRLGAFGHTWSLSIEEQFYLFWPPIVVLCLVAARRGLLTVLAGIGVVASTLARIWFVSTDEWAFRRVYYGLDARLDELFVGCLLAIALQRFGIGWMARISPAIMGTVGVAALIVLGRLLAVSDMRDVMTYRVKVSVLEVAVAALILVIVGRPTFVHALLELRPAVWVGRISYGLYLWHLPMVNMLSGRRLDKLGVAAALIPVIQIGVSVIVATASFYLFERRFLRLKLRFGTRATAPVTEGAT